MPNPFDDGTVLACADLTGRAGASQLQIGFLDDNPDNPRWYAHAQYQGARIATENHGTAAEAALALAERLLSGATCRCRLPVVLSDRAQGCRWRLVGQRWEPECDAPSVFISNEVRGNHVAMRQAMDGGGRG